MTTITLPADIESTLVEAARKRGVSPERLALDVLRKSFPPEALTGGSLFDFLSGYIGTVSGSTEAYSERTGQHFIDILVERQQRTRQ